MKELKLTDRIVVEIMAQQGDEFSYQVVAEQLRMIADAIEEGRKGGDWHDEDLTQIRGIDDVPCEVLWEHESKDYGGFRIVSGESLIRPCYYGSESKPNLLEAGEFSVTSINRQDLIDLGYDVSRVSDDVMEGIASRMGKAYHEGYCYSWSEDLRCAADYYGVPRKED